jgi:hypothetical protein
MATTLQDIIAKRAELQKTNPNATNVDARKALETSPTASINQMQYEINKQNRQNMANA